jgi:hypothetical protein
VKRPNAGKEEEEQEKERHDVETASSPTGRARNPTGNPVPNFFT